MNQPKCILGVDPGISGAFALYDPTLKTLIGVWDMPTYRLRGKDRIKIPELAMRIDSIAKDIRLAVIEEVSARPGQGVTSMFRFGHALGIAQGVVASSMIPIFSTPPSVWKTVMGVNKQKSSSVEKATALFPDQASNWARKKDHGRAEAALLAVFGESVL